MDISRLYNRCVFRSEVPVGSHAPLQRLLGNDHVLHWSPGTVDSALFCVETPRLKLMLLRYGPEVEVRPRPFVGFSLIQMPLRGSMRIDTDDEQVTVDTGQAVLVSPNGGARVKWSEGCEQIMLRVPHQILREAGQSPALLGGGPVPVPRAVARPLSDADTGRWRMLLESLLDAVSPPSADSVAGHPAWMDQAERSLALFALLQAQRCHAGPDRVPAVDDAGPGLPDSMSHQRMDTVARYVARHLCAPISLEDMARAAGVRPRTLYMDCVRLHGVGPMIWLRGVRLEAARQRLLGRTGGSVTDVATACGFGHLGRFASYYRERFGELPSESA